VNKEKHNSTLNENKRLQVFAELVQLYPDKEVYIKQYAQLLLAAGKTTTATEMLQRLYQLLIQKGDVTQADALTRQFPIIGRIQKNERHLGDIQSLLPASLRKKLWLKLHRKRLREGQHLIRHGETGDSLYLVCEGELAEFSHDAQGKPILLNLIGAGDVVGENKLFNPGSYTSDIAANKHSVVVKLPRKKMIAALHDNPALKTALQRKADQRHLVATISSSPLLQTIPLHLRRHLAKHGFIQEYGVGNTIHTSGEQLQHVDLIVQGEACYQLQGANITRQLKPLKPGALIGETAAVRGSGCPADVVTHHGVSIFHMPYAIFVNVVEAYPPLKNSLSAYAAEQRAKLMQKLNELQTQELQQQQH